MKRIYLFLCLLILLSTIACGHRAAPMPKQSLTLPPPDWIVLSIVDGRVNIVNSSDTYPVVVERAISELGDLSFPAYTRIGIVAPSDTFVDNTTESGIRYSYRLTTAHNRYYVYSTPITRIVSFRGPVKIESIIPVIVDDNLCPRITTTPSVNHTLLYLNGQLTTPDNKGCYPLPLTVQVLMVVVPYTESDTPGTPYSTTITRDIETALLPPQNIRIVRVNDNITLTWDTAANATGYQVTVDGITTVIDETIFRWKAVPGTCVNFTLRTIWDKRLSSPIIAESCP